MAFVGNYVNPVISCWQCKNESRSSNQCVDCFVAKYCEIVPFWSRNIQQCFDFADSMDNTENKTTDSSIVRYNQSLDEASPDQGQSTHQT